MKINYEYPLNERMRTFLKLNYSFENILHFINQSTPFDTKACISNFLELIQLADRIDIRSELIKELDKNITNLNQLFDTPMVNIDMLQGIVDKLSSLATNIKSLPCRINKQKVDDELLTNVKQRSTSFGSIYSFDCQLFNKWLHEDAKLRIKTIKGWLEGYQVILNAITYILDLYRQSGSVETKIAENGSYQRSLDPSANCQIIRLSIDNSYNMVPEFSGSKHRVNFSFMEIDDKYQAKRTNNKVEFELACCAI